MSLISHIFGVYLEDKFLLVESLGQKEYCREDIRQAQIEGHSIKYLSLQNCHDYEKQEKRSSLIRED